MQAFVALVLEHERIAAVALVAAGFATAGEREDRRDDGAERAQAHQRGTVIRVE
jgi:hypothetical protein